MSARSLAPNPVDGLPFVHRALMYATREELVSGSVPFIDEGLRSGHRVLVIVHPANLEPLRSALGARADHVRFTSSEAWYVQPAEVIGRYLTFIHEQLAKGWPSIHIIGEVPWPAGDDRLEREWLRYESVLNAVLAGLPVRVVCPYDATRLPASVIDGARTTHPSIVVRGVETATGDYMAPERFLGDVTPVLAPPADRAGRRFRPRDVVSASSYIAGRARLAGLGEAATSNLVAASLEVLMDPTVGLRVDAAAAGVSDAISITTWTEDNRFVTQIEDEGGGNGDPSSGYGPPASGAASGWGAWIARHLTDTLEIATGPRGACVQLTERLGDPSEIH